MPPLRELLIALALVCIGAGTGWLLHTGQWRQIANRIPFIAPDAPPAPEDESIEDQKSPGADAPVNAIRMWRDANGVVHFADNKNAPSNAGIYRPREPETLADHVDAIENSELSMEKLYRASQERAAREKQGMNDAGSDSHEPPDASVVPAIDPDAR